jgi:excisionase family DNA binding protein
MTVRLLSYVDAAAYLSLPVGTLRSLVCRRQIPHVRITARLVKFDPADLDAWIDQHRVPSPAP